MFWGIEHDALIKGILMNNLGAYYFEI